MRNTHWIAFGARIWASELLWSPTPDRSLPVELVHSATREIRLRTEFTTGVIGSLAAREHEVPPPVVLVDCARLGTALIRDGSRDVENDIVRTARFLPGVDARAIHDTLAQAIRRLNDHLVDVRYHEARERPT
jgi:hypothetical protein